MKKRKTSSRGTKAAKAKRKPIMRHSREGMKGGRPKARTAKAKKRKKSGKKSGSGPRRKTRPVSGARGAKRVVPKTKSKAPRRAGSRAGAKKASPARPGRRREGPDMGVESPSDARGLGAESAGQSGDTEGLSRAEDADSESVEELVEEGQAFEAGVISGVESSRRSGRRGVRTRQVPEDDVPQEYLDED